MDLSKQAISGLIDKENPIILDIGMYDGEDARELALAFPKGKVYGFECDPRSISLFKSFDNPKNIMLNEVAIGSKNALIDLYLSDSQTRRHYTDQDSWSASSSIRQPKKHLDLFPDVSFNKSIKVECITLDKWRIDNISTEIIDFVWADINGAEYDMILGGQKTLNEFTRYLYVEFSDKELYLGQPKKRDMLNLLPNFMEVAIYNFRGNFGNVLLKNTEICR
jgi:FkbM family methyltransferase